MTAIPRRLWAISACVALLFAIAGLAGGCVGSTDCKDTATCPTTGDDVAVGDDGAFEASDAIVETGGNSADATLDASDDATAARNGTLDGGDASMGNGTEADTGDGDAAKDAPFEAEAEASASTCLSNVLAPTLAVASSVNGANVAANAIDHIFTTRWESVQGVDPQWIYLDFGAPVFIDRVQIAWETACGQNYDLQTSNDAVGWSNMSSITGNTTGGPAPVDWTTAVNHQGFTGVGRYLRIFGTIRCAMGVNYGYSIWEMQVYGDTNAGCHL